MTTVRLLDSVKMDDPYVIVGDKNATIELSEPAANWAVTQKLAEFGAQEIPVVQTGQNWFPEERKVVDPADLVSDPEAGRESDSQPEDEPKRPYGNAPKDAWIEYACAVDPELSVDRAKGMTKNDLMSKYGERL